MGTGVWCLPGAVFEVPCLGARRSATAVLLTANFAFLGAGEILCFLKAGTLCTLCRRPLECSAGKRVPRLQGSSIPMSEVICLQTVK